MRVYLGALWLEKMVTVFAHCCANRYQDAVSRDCTCAVACSWVHRVTSAAPRECALCLHWAADSPSSPQDLASRDWSSLHTAAQPRVHHDHQCRIKQQGLLMFAHCCTAKSTMTTNAGSDSRDNTSLHTATKSTKTTST